MVSSSAECARIPRSAARVVRLYKVLASPPKRLSDPKEEGMHRRRLGVTLTAFALLFTVMVSIAGASDLTPGPLVQVSGTSPFLSCTADSIGTQSGTVFLNSEVEPWIDVNRANTSNVVGIFQQDRWSN